MQKPSPVRNRVRTAARRALLALALTLTAWTGRPAAAQHARHAHGGAAQPSAPAAPAAIPGAPAGAQTILGDVVPFGDGTARSWVRVDDAGKPSAVGITLTEAALSGLPADVTPGLIWMVEYVLALPTDVALPFDHIGVNWNPKGHMPSEIYTVPHFDFHFYTISPAERSRITARGDDLDRIRKAPPEGQVPDGYIFAPGAEEPGMGGHWVDTGSHEFHGHDFTSTFIYGSYDGEVIFYEPMITKAFLETQPDVVLPLAVPRAYAEAGYYPTSYAIRYDTGRREYTVALEGMTWREAAGAL